MLHPRMQGCHFAAESVESLDELSMLFIGRCGVKRLQIKCAIGFELASENLVKTFKALTMDDSQQFFTRERFTLQCSLIEMAVLDEDGGLAFEHAREPWRTEKKPHHEPIDRQEGEGANDAAGDGIVVPDDCVLNSIRERKQNNQIEWVELGQFSFTENAHKQDQREIDKNGPDNLFRQWKRKLKQVVEEM